MRSYGFEDTDITEETDFSVTLLKNPWDPCALCPIEIL